MMRGLLVAAFAALLVCVPHFALALERGSVTNLPLPRFVSLKATEGNARRGPDMMHRIDWVFTRRDLPLRVTAEYEHWRRVEDAEGQGGWMHYALLSGVRSALVQADMAQMHSRADANSPLVARLESGVIARIRTCRVDWCRLEVEGNRGWVRKADIWGVSPEEEF